MEIEVGIHGENANKDYLIQKGFIFNPTKDFIETENVIKFNFVGALKNKKNDLLVIFPKNYNIVFNKNEIKSEIKKIFEIIIYRRNLDGTFTIFEEKNEKSSYPFNEFYYIYNYYKEYGFPFIKKKILTSTITKQVAWSQTIKNANYFLSNGKLILWGFKYKKEINELNFLSDCMIYAINTTIKNYSFLIDLPYINTEMTVKLDENNYDIVINELMQIKNKTYIDKEKILIDNLIQFYLKLSKGYTNFFKEYSFHDIWEKMVNQYLTAHIEFDCNKNDIIFSKNANVKKFIKKSFNLNDMNKEQLLLNKKIKNRVIEIDHFYIDTINKIVYVFDSKYKFSITELDYKQMIYWLYIKDFLEINNYENYKICCFLVIPTNIEGYYIKDHVHIACGNRLKGLKIKELYVNMNNVVDYYYSLLINNNL